MIAFNANYISYQACLIPIEQQQNKISFSIATKINELKAEQCLDNTKIPILIIVANHDSISYQITQLQGMHMFMNCLCCTSDMKGFCSLILFETCSS